MVYATIADQAALIDPVFGRLHQNHSFVAMQGVAAIAFEQQNKFHINTLLESAPSGWNKTGKTDLTSTEVTYDAAAGDQKGSFPVAAALSRMINSRQQKIIVSGDADLMSNLALKAPKGYNLTYSQLLFKWFCNGEFPVDVSRFATTDDTLQIKRKQLSTFKLVFLAIVPALIVALGAFILIGRKRK